MDPAKQRYAKIARDALIRDVEEASGNPTLGAAARLIGKSRKEYGRAMRALKLQKVLSKTLDPKSEGGQLLSPARFASINTGERRAKLIEPLLRDQPEMAAQWDKLAEAARALSRSGSDWMPQSISSPAVKKGIDRIFKLRNVAKILGDDDLSERLLRAVSPDTPAEEAAALIPQILARLQISSNAREDDDK